MGIWDSGELSRCADEMFRSIANSTPPWVAGQFQCRHWGFLEQTLGSGKLRSCAFKVRAPITICSWIRVRCMVPGISDNDWEAYLAKIFELLKPGTGSAILIELDYRIQYKDRQSSGPHLKRVSRFPNLPALFLIQRRKVWRHCLWAMGRKGITLQLRQTPPFMQGNWFWECHKPCVWNSPRKLVVRCSNGEWILTIEKKKTGRKASRVWEDLMKTLSSATKDGPEPMEPLLQNALSDFQKILKANQPFIKGY